MGAVGAVAKSSSGDSDDTSQRNEVMARANDFAVAYNTYDVADLAGYQKRLKGLLTPKYNEQFVEVTNAIFSALADRKQTSGNAKVLGTAIESIDDDSAVAIVAVDASITNTDTKAAVLRNFRWKISFSKSGGDWLVASFESVASVEAEAGQPTPVPGSAGTPGSTEGSNQ